jgi:hypothetical protein
MLRAKRATCDIGTLIRRVRRERATLTAYDGGAHLLPALAAAKSTMQSFESGILS